MPASRSVAILVLCGHIPSVGAARANLHTELEASSSSNMSCADQDSFCPLHLDMCEESYAQTTCVRTCCGVFKGTHRGNSHAAGKRRALQEKMKQAGSWGGVCSTQCPSGRSTATATTTGGDTPAPGRSPRTSTAPPPQVGCFDKGPFCSIHLDVCASKAEHSSCRQTCCGVLQDTHYGNSHHAVEKRTMQQKMKEMGSWGDVCSEHCPLATPVATTTAPLPQVDGGCADKGSLCTIHLDVCTGASAQTTCLQTCCGVLQGSHYGNSHSAVQKKALQQQMKESSHHWDVLCAAQCPVAGNEENSLAELAEDGQSNATKA